MDTRSERARAVLVGAAYADALAMPTCGMTPEQITSVYGDFRELIDADASHTTMPGAPAGTVTEVTREILAEASALLGGSFSFPVTADDAHSPTDHTHARRCVLRAIPVGIATSTQDPEAFADAVWEACAEGPTTRQEFQAAALIATFISIGLDWPDSRPMDIEGVLWETVNYVASMEPRGSWSAEPDVLATTRRAANVVSCQRSMYFSEFTKAFGHPSTPTQIVPFALAFTLHVLLGFSPYVARLGGDTTSCSALVAALMGSVLGASAFRDAPLDAVEEVNHLDLSAVARELVALRPPAPGDPREQAEYVELEIAPSGPSSFEEPGSSLRTRQSLFEQVSPPTPLGPVRGDAPAGRLIFMGQLVLNQSLRTASFPEAGGDVWADDEGMRLTGNIEVLRAAQRMGVEAVSLSPIGEGPHASLIEEYLRREGIVDAGPRVPGMDNGYQVTITDNAGAHYTITTNGAEYAAPRRGWAEVAQTLGPSDVLYIDGTLVGTAYGKTHPNSVPATEALLALPEYVRIVVDPSRAARTPFGLRSDNVVLVMTQEEASSLGTSVVGDRSAFDACRTPDGAAEEICRLFDSHSIIRAGTAGAYIGRPTHDRGRFVWSTSTHIPAPSTNKSDLPEARHVYSGVLAASLALGTPFERSVLLANCAEVLAASGNAMAPSCPPLEDIEAAADALEERANEE